MKRDNKNMKKCNILIKQKHEKKVRVKEIELFLGLSIGIWAIVFSIFDSIAIFEPYKWILPIVSLGIFIFGLCEIREVKRLELEICELEDIICAENECTSCEMNKVIICKVEIKGNDSK